MRTIADATALEALVRRLHALTPDTPHQFGHMSPGEMLCHLADATASVLDRPGGPAGHSRRFRKWLTLYTTYPWKHDLGLPTQVNRRIDGTRPGDFEADRARAIANLQALAVAPPSALPRSHEDFGPMTAEDWQHWGYRHTDHHLRQFGV